MSVSRLFAMLATSALVSSAQAQLTAPDQVDLAKLNTSAKITPEQALTGSMAEFSSFLNQYSKQNWPDLHVGFAGSDNFIKKGKGVSTLEGFYKQYPAADGTPFNQENAAQVTTVIAGQIITDLVGSMFTGKELYQIPSAMALALQPVSGIPNMSLTVMASNACAHCLAPNERDRYSSCNITDPAEVRLSQFGRMATGLHEYTHTIDSGLKMREEISALPSARGKLHETNTAESLADANMLLMMVKLYGDEGYNAGIGWMHRRTDAMSKGNHYTVPTVKATLDYIEAHKDDIARMSPVELLAKAKDITAATALTEKQVAIIDTYITKKTEPSEPAEQAWLAQYKDDIKNRDSKLGPVIEQFMNHNPLNTPEWKAAAEAKEAACRVQKSTTKWDY